MLQLAQSRSGEAFVISLPDKLAGGAELLMEAAILGRSWKHPLNTIAEAVGANSGAVSRLSAGGKFHAEVSPRLEEGLSNIISGKTPPMSQVQHFAERPEDGVCFRQRP